MKTPSELKSELILFIKHLYQADHSSSAMIHWWWLKRLVDLCYKPTLLIIYIFTYIPPFSWLYHAFEGIFGKNGYIGVGSVVGLYIAIYGVAQSTNQDELTRQERAIEKYETAMKQTNQREKLYGMKGLVKLSAEPVQRKPVFKCPIKYGKCDTFWFELEQQRLDVISEELSHFYAQCHKEQNCNQKPLVTNSEVFDLKYLEEDKDFINYHDFRALTAYVRDSNYLLQYPRTSISYQIYNTITPLLDLKNLELINLDVSRWKLFNSQLRNTVFDGTNGEFLDMRASVYRRVTFKQVEFNSWIVDGSLIYNSHFTDSVLNLALLRKGVSLVKNHFTNTSITFNNIHNVSFADSKFKNTSITLNNLTSCSKAKDLDYEKQQINIDDIKLSLQNGDSDTASAIYRSKLSCNMILPNRQECRFISKSRCLTSSFKLLDTKGLTMR
ncbi:MAG: hypothetical protein ACI8WB_002617 [Phenylobacterium sp.]|jgi:uncharacterized protein YjbI with pentapeptide repeats